MHIIYRFLILSIILSNISASNNSSNPHIIGIMVEFQDEDPNNPLTSGTGSFLDSLQIEMIWDESGRDRCDGFIVDRPPHNVDYFNSQIQALSNYYLAVSNGNINIDWKVIVNPEENSKGYYKLSKEMELYSYSDNDLSSLFKESLELAKNDIEQYLIDNEHINFSDIIFTVFHAGISQDFSFPTFDPTIYDIKSAYIEPSMFINNLNYPIIANQEVSSGILLPETQNMIFFDSVEDIFYGEDTYCDTQLGMTSTFAFLMGYALGLPPLFNVNTGELGVGVFALMDYGSNNGRGIIPAFPSPWTRILKNWQESINMTDSVSFAPLVFDIESDNIYRFDISEDEYFLIENHNNQLDHGKALIDIVFDYNYELYGDTLDSYIEYISKNWFDALIAVKDYNTRIDPALYHSLIFEFSDDSVIVAVKDYDLGFPGSGLLIWHIDEPQGDITAGINNDRNNRAVSIEEADGALDIGFESYALFQSDDPTIGKKWDLWFKGNDGYYSTNNNAQICLNSQNYEVLEQYSSQYQCEQNEGKWVKPIIFDKYSNPNSDLNDGTPSFFSFELLDSISQDIQRVKVKYESPIEYVDYSYLSDFEIIGTSPAKIFYKKQENVYSFNLSDTSFELIEHFSGSLLASIILTDSNNQSYSTSVFHHYCYFDNQDQLICEDDQPFFGYFNSIDWIDYFSVDYLSNFFNINVECEGDDCPAANWTSLENLDIATNDISIGDVDFDGLDEIVWTFDGKINAANINGTMVNGFPIEDNYYGIVLILENQDNQIVLASRNDNHIDIISLDGDILYSLPSIGDQDILAIGGKLTDGVRFYDFSVGEGSYWLQRYSNHSHYLFPSGDHIVPDYENDSYKMTKFYNYPNPINDGETTFRFMMHNNIGVDINIYNLSGHKVDNLTLDSPTIHEYNEIKWITGDLLPGLYFAELMFDNKKEKIIKVVIGH